MREYMEKNVKSALSRPLRGRYKRLLSISVSTLLSISTFLTVIPQTATTVYADSGKTITGLCTGAIGNPTPGDTAGLTGWKGSYVYYGKYGENAMKYRVLDKATTQFNTNTTMLLDCDNTIVDKRFDEDSKEWAGSEIKSWLNGNEFLGDKNYPQGAFTFQERKAIATSTKNSAATEDGDGWAEIGYAQLTGEHVFLLDAVEATRPSYGYADTSAADATRSKSGANTLWWLRSPILSSYDYYAGIVDPTGDIIFNHVYDGFGVSPAFNLNLSSVIFSSLISGTAGSAGAAYKLTIADNNLGITPGTITRSGSTITVPYTITGTNKNNAIQVSVLIMDSAYSAGTAAKSGYTYQKLNVTTWGTSGTGTFTLPAAYANKTCGTDYYAYILAEDVNGTYETDYASLPASITIPAKPTFSPVPKEDDDDEEGNEEPAKPAAVNPDTVEGYFAVGGQPVPGVTMGKTVQGPAAQAVLNAASPAGYMQAFTFNMAVNGKVDYTLKNGVLTIIIPKEYQKAGRSFAIMALDKNGKAWTFADTDTNPATVTATINVEGYAFALIYKD